MTDVQASWLVLLVGARWRTFSGGTRGVAKTEWIGFGGLTWRSWQADHGEDQGAALHNNLQQLAQGMDGWMDGWRRCCASGTMGMPVAPVVVN